MLDRGILNDASMKSSNTGKCNLMKIIDEVFTFNMVDSKDDFNSSNFKDKQNKIYFPLSYEL